MKILKTIKYFFCLVFVLSSSYIDAQNKNERLINTSPLLIENPIIVNTANSSCNNPDLYKETIYSLGQISIQRNIHYSYYLDPLTNRPLVLDYYTANESCTNRPLIVLVHGGGFASGYKEQLINEAIAFARKGYAVFTIDYRLMGNPLGVNSDPPNVNTTTICHGGAFNDMAWYWAMQDLNAAIKHITYFKDLYRIDPNKVFLFGNSAGAITALQLAYTTEQEVFDTFPGVDFNAHWFLGNLDLTTHPLFRSQTYTIKGVAAVSGALQRNHYLDANETVPVIMLHNPCDILVNYNVGNNGLGNIFGVPCNSTFYGSKYIYDQMETWTTSPAHELYADCDLPAGIEHGLNSYTYFNSFVNNKIGPFFHKILNNQTSTSVLTPLNTNNYCDSNLMCSIQGKISNANSNDDSVEQSLNFKDLVERMATEYPNKKITSDEEILIYPNPTNNQTNIHLGFWKGEKVTIQLYSTLGKLVLSSEVFVENSNQETTIDLSNNTNGIYLVKIISKAGVKSSKIIKR